MKVWSSEIAVNTKGKFQLIDITNEIKQEVKKSKINNGIVSIVSKHTTTAVLLNENEKLLLDDFENVAKRLLPVGFFLHDSIEERRKDYPELPEDECQNGEAHCLSIFLSNSQTLHIVDGELNLGKWQTILFWELDEVTKYRLRDVSITIIGERKPPSAESDPF